MYIRAARAICFSLERQEVCRAFSRAWAKTGKRMAARIAIMAITTSSSIRVKPRFLLCICQLLLGRGPVPIWRAGLVADLQDARSVRYRKRLREQGRRAGPRCLSVE